MYGMDKVRDKVGGPNYSAKRRQTPDAMRCFPAWWQTSEHRQATMSSPCHEGSSRAIVTSVHHARHDLVKYSHCLQQKSILHIPSSAFCNASELFPASALPSCATFRPSSHHHGRYSMYSNADRPGYLGPLRCWKVQNTSEWAEEQRGRDACSAAGYLHQNPPLLHM